MALDLLVGSVAFKRQKEGGAYLAQSEELVTPDLGPMSLRP